MKDNKKEINKYIKLNNQKNIKFRQANSLPGIGKLIKGIGYINGIKDFISMSNYIIGKYNILLEFLVNNSKSTGVIGTFSHIFIFLSKALTINKMDKETFLLLNNSIYTLHSISTQNNEQALMTKLRSYNMMLISKHNTYLKIPNTELVRIVK